MDNQLFPYTVSSIVVDNFKGGYEVARHLLELGHTKIGCIGGPHHLLSAEHRVNGFETAMKEVGLEPFVIQRGEFDIEAGYKTTINWIDEGQLPSAIICGDDHIAFGVMDALKVKGINVPDDVSVIGYDDHPFASKLHPHLSTVKQPAVDIGIKGVEALFDQMRGKKKNNIVIKLEPELIPRSTTSMPPER
jgi:DNA-binding LacI/PurR family transcriptional regulator